MDRHGSFSPGTNCDYVALHRPGPPLFLEVNDRMPRTFGANQVHVSEVAGYVEVDRPLVEVLPDAHLESTTDRRPHGQRIIPDGATIQAGIGSIPNAPPWSAGHRDLGVHTELLSDGLVDLIEPGVVTGTRKRGSPRGRSSRPSSPRHAAALRLPGRELRGGVPPGGLCERPG